MLGRVRETASQPKARSRHICALNRDIDTAVAPFEFEVLSPGELALGYVAESALWGVNYRLVLDV